MPRKKKTGEVKKKDVFRVTVTRESDGKEITSYEAKVAIVGSVFVFLFDDADIAFDQDLKKHPSGLYGVSEIMDKFGEKVFYPVVEALTKEG